MKTALKIILTPVAFILMPLIGIIAIFYHWTSKFVDEVERLWKQR